MGRNTHTQLMECQALLAREREAGDRLRAEVQEWIDTSDQEEVALGLTDKQRERAEEAEGRVRELREERGRVQAVLVDFSEGRISASLALPKIGAILLSGDAEALVGLPDA